VGHRFNNLKKIPKRHDSVRFQEIEAGYRPRQRAGSGAHAFKFGSTLAIISSIAGEILDLFRGLSSFYDILSDNREGWQRLS
jgi:hypothetical protein